jgi:hypothetical protein
MTDATTRQRSMFKLFMGMTRRPRSNGLIAKGWLKIRLKCSLTITSHKIDRTKFIWPANKICLIYRNYDYFVYPLFTGLFEEQLWSLGRGTANPFQV